MGWQIIKQPDGRFGVFSYVVDAFVLLNATADDVETYFVQDAERETRRRVREKIECVEAGRPRDAYHQFAIPWSEAVRRHNTSFPKGKIKEPRA